MKKILIPALVILLVTFQAVLAQKRETRSVGTFTQLNYRVPGKLYLKQGSTQKVEIEGTNEVLSKIETKVEDGKLIIEVDWKKWSNWKWGDNEKATVYVTVKDLNSIGVSGSGDLISEAFSSDKMDLKVSGSGSLSIEVNATGNMDAAVSGSGSITLKGKCKDFYSNVSGSGKVSATVAVAGAASFSVSGSGRIVAEGSSDNTKAHISGSGKFQGSNFETKSCQVRISGSGGVEVYVKEELDASISGSGSVAYRGNPSKVNSHSSGSGRVRSM